MRIIQSFWSKPLRVSEDPSRAAKMNFGWPVRKYNYFSLALSCLQLASYYPDLELVTDDFGENLLIHKLQLPYKSVRSELNKLDDYHSGLWALGKIYSYSIQDGPFLHVDSDLFIFREFDRNIGSARLVAQNKETGILEYTNAFRQVCRDFSYIPDVFRASMNAPVLSCCNAGIMGGTDIGFFKDFASEVFAFLDRSPELVDSRLARYDPGNFNIVIEQMLFFLLAENKGIPIEYLFPGVSAIPPYLGHFHSVERNRGVVHALSHYKREEVVFRLVERNLEVKYPEFHRRILHLMETCQI